MRQLEISLWNLSLSRVPQLLPTPCRVQPVAPHSHFLFRMRCVYIGVRDLHPKQHIFVGIGVYPCRFRKYSLYVRRARLFPTAASHRSRRLYCRSPPPLPPRVPIHASIYPPLTLHASTHPMPTPTGPPAASPCSDCERRLRPNFVLCLLLNLGGTQHSVVHDSPVVQCNTTAGLRCHCVGNTVQGEWFAGERNVVLCSAASVDYTPTCYSSTWEACSALRYRAV
jgi:hypothetical protein